MNEEALDRIRMAAVKHLTRIPSPTSVGEINNQLLADIDLESIGCDCQLCTIRAALAAETYVVIEEALKMVPEDSEPGVAGLIYRLHLAHLEDLRSLLFLGHHGPGEHADQQAGEHARQPVFAHQWAPWDGSSIREPL